MDVLIIGASGGIGAALAASFTASGAAVSTLSRREDGLELTDEGSIIAAAAALKDRGAKRIYAYATHPVFSEPAIERINDSAIDRVIVTDTIPLAPNAVASSKIRQVSIAPLIAEAIRRIHHGDSVSSLFV